MTLKETYEVIIIGGGIIGCACAASLAQAGLKVALIEPGTIGGGTTAAGMGHLVVMDDNPAELALSSYSLELWRALVTQGQRESARHEYMQCGTIWVAADEEEMEAARAKLQVLQAHDIACEMLSAQQLQQLEPQLRPGLAGGLLVKQDALVYPPKSAQILLDLALAHGATLHRQTVTELIDGGVKCSDGSEISAQHIVVANGIASTKLIADLPLRYKKGHLVITDRYPNFIQHQLVELGYIKSAHASDGDSVAFNLQPRPTGQVFIGSSRQFDVTHKEIDTDILSKMLTQATSYVPALANLKAIRTWTGFRAATPDGLPYIGPHPNKKNVWMATGHEGLGITTSLATAAILRDQICQQTSKIAVEPYWPSRSMSQH
ncbi:NAD(P)/FAD-dependent oxidoreductase [Undibacterium flavidum]|uniref:FAD-binding oxidoreductase n=1 Tax=Undibacterium flavidum TaxID=2762297 RepID=A0ABR6YEY8_9BURK|nr:FAD-dependent oxidoreductase [Undibacterium flavidum]MBC3875113.1 FAD-binding oxidoreductase [Undibacterium flavidum]